MDDLSGLLCFAIPIAIPIAIIIALVFLVKSTREEEVAVKVEIQQMLTTLPKESQAAFILQYNNAKKNPTTAVVLALLLGGIGAHKFYMGQTGSGILYLIFSCTFIPAIIAFIEAFTISKSVHSSNRKAAREAAVMLGGNSAALLN